MINTAITQGAREAIRERENAAAGLLKRDKEISFLKDCIATARRDNYPSHMIKYYDDSLLKAERDREIFIKVKSRWLGGIISVKNDRLGRLGAHTTARGA